MEPQPPWSATAPPGPARRFPPGTIAFVVIAGVVVLGLVVTLALVFSGVLSSNDTRTAEKRTGIAQPISLLPVEEEYAAPCRPGDQSAGKLDPDKCHRLGTGMVVTSVRQLVTKVGTDGKGVVQLSLNPDDARAFGDLTTRLAAEQPPRNLLAIVVNGQVLSTPQVMSPIPGGEVEISGNFTVKEARDLVAKIKG
ncbi:hypothetical protein AB0M43_12125 [Longispora sp. NPDC051575]|uniref:SecDF P1 head subdomain-containing protein n=1 Tax=Longispora sp. NPDC051575 TaxID=3154943 RepID=UPI003437BC22